MTTKTMDIKEYMELGQSDLMEIARAIADMEGKLSKVPEYEHLAEKLRKTLSSVLDTSMYFKLEENKLNPLSLEDEIKQLEEKKEKKQKKEQKEVKEPIPEIDLLRQYPLGSPERELQNKKRDEDGRNIHIRPLETKKPISPIRELKKKSPPPGMGQISGGSMNIDTLLALADKLDAAGEEEKANQIDEIVKKMATEPKKVDFNNKETEYSPEIKEMMENDKIANEQENSAIRSLESAVEMIKAAIHAANDNAIALFGSKELNYLISSAHEFYNFVEKQANLSKLSDAEGATNTKDMLEKFAVMADKLDAIGATEEAGLIDEFISKNAGLLTSAKKDVAADPYDSKAHHSEQIREPKPKAVVEKHHIPAYQETKAPSLSTRYCPSHIGVTMGRVGENTYQCPIDNEVYNWEIGFKNEQGIEFKGSSVAAQTPNSSDCGGESSRMFDSRENTLNSIH